MAFCELHIYSEALGVQTTVNVVIPQRKTAGEIGVENCGDQEQYPCLYLLHGLSDDHTIWHRRTSIERYAQKYGVCVVMPFGGRSFYTDTDFEKYYTYIAKELPAIIQDTFPVSGKREDNFIAGNSMGGYGALKIALKCCEQFSAGAGLSSVADVLAVKEHFPTVFHAIFGEEVPKEEDLFYLAEETEKNPQKPRLLSIIGTEDFLYQDNLRLKAHLENLDFDFTYQESAGGHTWGFWDDYLPTVLTWMLKK